MLESDQLGREKLYNAREAAMPGDSQLQRELPGKEALAVKMT